MKQLRHDWSYRDLQLSWPGSQTWSREVLQLCCHQDFAHIHNTHSSLTPGPSDCFYALPVIWKTMSPCKHRGPSSEGNIWRQTPGRAQDPQPCLAHGCPGTAAQIPSMQEALVKILLWFEKQWRQILGNTNLICDTEKPKNLFTEQPCPCTARHLASFIHSQLFYCRAFTKKKLQL